MSFLTERMSITCFGFTVSNNLLGQCIVTSAVDAQNFYCYEERLAIGEMKPINFDALREHANKVNSVPVVQMFQGTILTEETVSDVMIRRAQMLMYIQKKEVLPFAVDDHNREILRALKLYILKDERFETEGHGSLSKGIVLAGLQGCGKTMLLKMMADAGPVDYKHKGFVSPSLSWERSSAYRTSY